MAKFRVTILHDACTTHDVEADDDKGAADKAFEDASVNLCHQCSREIELADPIRAVSVENLDTGETNDEVDPPFEVTRLRERVAELETAARAVTAHMVGALPIRGYLRDNDASRQALGELARVLGELK